MPRKTKSEVLEKPPASPAPPPQIIGSSARVQVRELKEEEIGYRIISDRLSKLEWDSREQTKTIDDINNILSDISDRLDTTDIQDKFKEISDFLERIEKSVNHVGDTVNTFDGALEAALVNRS